MLIVCCAVILKIFKGGAYELGKNKHWRGSGGNMNLVSANLLHAHRTRTVNLLTDNNPTFNVKRVQITDDSEDQFYDYVEEFYA